MKRTFLTLIFASVIFTGFSQDHVKYSFSLDFNPLTATRIAFSPDSKYLVYGTVDGEIIGMDLTTGAQGFRFKGHDSRVISVAYSPDGTQMASGDKDGILKTWDMTRHNPLFTVEAHSKAILAVAYSPDGAILFSGGRDNYVHVREAATTAKLRSIGKTKGNIRSIEFSPDGKYIICATSALLNSIHFYDIATGKLVKKLPSDNTQDIAISPDERILASANLEKDVFLWDIRADTLFAVLSGHTKYIKDVAFSPGGKMLVSCSDDHLVKLWDVEKRTELAAFSAHTGEVEGVAYSPDGTMIASVSWDNTIKVYDLEGIERPSEDLYVKPDITQLTEEEQQIVNTSFSNLEFETDKADIKPVSYASLDELAKLLVEKDNYRLELSGHTDNVGDATYNFDLSIKRADSVKIYLVGKGVHAAHITAKGFGATKPIADNRTEEGRKKNRRVEFNVLVQ